MPPLAPVLVVAAASYGCSVLLGVLVAARVLDTSGFRWLHHALYLCTFLFAAAVVALAAAGGQTTSTRAAGWLLAPALVPFALIPFLGSRGARHRVVGSIPAPFYLAAILLLALG